tara:strand:+ start:2050 stop:2220 length:171 start_codon:yes stop_codon:yes gene_type:complete
MGLSRKKNPFPLFAVLTSAGIAMLQMFVKDISLIIGIMLVSTVIFLINSVSLYKMG